MLIQAHEEKSFLGWMRETGNMFTGEEYHFRLGIWLNNKRLVQSHNAANLGFTLALNKLAHLSPAEYKSMLGYRPSKVQKKFYSSKATADGAVDWRNKGVVNPIQDQGSCGSCWAFSAIQTQESRYAIVYGQLQKLSEQNLVDCAKTCHGCSGGEMYLGLEYALGKQNGKFMLESDYPYTGVDGTCKYDSSKAVSKITGYEWAETGNENSLAIMISDHGPASIGVDASLYTFHLYSSGIYSDPACSIWSLDHGVGCVGYGSEGSNNYWIIRN